MKTFLKPTIRDGIVELGIFEKSDDVWVNSLDVARVFDKRHDNVMRDIDKIIEDADSEFTVLNFEVSKYKDSSGKQNKQYKLSRKGFSLLAMGFTGKKAMEFKVAYINAFENMAELIFTRQHSKQGYKIMSEAVMHNIGNYREAYADEANRVNHAVLGMRSSDFRQLHGLKNGETPRDAVVQEKLSQIDTAQRLNASLIIAGIHGDERSRILKANYGVTNG